MKQLFFPLMMVSVLLFSCTESSTQDKVKNTVDKAAADAGIESKDEHGKAGSFSFDGNEVSAEVTTQYFGADKEKSNFSVLCQHDDNTDVMNPKFELLQVTFINEKDATTNTSLKIYDGGSMLPMTEPEPGIVSVSLSGNGSGLGKEEFTGNEKSTGTITVANRTVTLKNLVLFTRSGEKKTVNATLPF